MREEITSFGHWVRRQRKALDLTQAVLANRVGCALVTVKKIERDERRPSRQLAELLADQLTIPAADRERFIDMGRGKWVESVATPSAPVESPSHTGRLAPHNLPPQATTFVGRQSELATLGEWLADPEKRLMTIVAPGGMGKTRLSLAVAEAQISSGRFADGVFFAALADIHERSQLINAIADAIGCPVSRSPQPERTLLSQLAGQNMLLVLDNFEQLLSEADLLDAILLTTPTISLLISSRERLNVQSEWVLDLLGLPIPDAVHLDQSPAVELFVQRSRQLRKDFRRDQNEVAIARICQLTDGMPLALELAASWIRVMTADEIAAEIERSLDFLATRLRDVPARHRSMRAVFQATWAQLTPDEQRVFRRLSVFRNGFGFEAATAVAGATHAILLSLIDHALFVRDEHGRYRSHELLRQFGVAELTSLAGQEEAARAAHASYFADLMETLGPAFYGRSALNALERIDPDFDNMLLAWRWSAEHGEIEKLSQMMEILFFYAERRGHWLAGIDAYKYANHVLSSGATGTNVRPGIQGALFVYEGFLASRIRSPKFYQALLVKGTDMILADPLLRPTQFAHMIGELALAEYISGDVEASQRLLAKAFQLAQEHDDAWAFGLAYCMQGHVDEFKGNYRDAERDFEASIAAFENIGEEHFLSYSFNNLGRAAYAMGQYDKADRVIRAALDIRQRFQDVAAVAYSLLDLAKLARMRGNYAECKAHLVEGTAICERSGLLDTQARYHNAWGMLERTLGRATTAIEYHERSRQFYLTVPTHFSMPLTLNGLAAAEIARGEFDRAESWLAESLQLARELDNIFDQAVALTLGGEASLKQNHLTEAESQFTEALAIAARSGAAPLALQILRGMASLDARTEVGRLHEATALWRYITAHPATEAEIRSRVQAELAERSGNVPETDESVEDLWLLVDRLLAERV